MANPQIENGHIDIANEIGEALARTQLNGYESRYLWVLWRMTYGWHKKEDTIANSQFAKKTGIEKTHICRTEKKLIQRNIVTKNGNKLSFNKDYTQWRELPKMVTVTKIGTGVTKYGNKKLPKLVYTKETTKESITKENTAASPPPFILEEKLTEMETTKNSALDIVAILIREKPVRVDNSKQLSAVIARNMRVAKTLSGAYTNSQIFQVIDKIKADKLGIDWGLETVLKFLTK